MSPKAPFESIYRHGFLRLAIGTPRVALADPATNARRTIELAQRAVACKAVLAIFPELGISGYSLEDLALQDALLDGVELAVGEVIKASESLPAILAIGAPVRSEGKLFNCALVIHRGRLLGAVPKIYLPNYREFYEKRQYTSGSEAVRDTLTIAGQEAPFGSRLLFGASDWADFILHVEVCEDLWVPAAPSTYAALAGATVLTNLSASNLTLGKAGYRRLLCASQSAKCVAAYAYGAAGYGESTTDLAWDGHAIVCENGDLVAESKRFRYQDGVLTADIDLERLRQERMRMTSFSDCVQLHREQLSDFRRIEVELELPVGPVALDRPISRYPFVPTETATLDQRCEEVYNIQVQGLVHRMEATGINKLIIAVSGGLDSTHALLVAAKAVDALGLPRANVLGFTLPGFATRRDTRQTALRLMDALGVNSREIDIKPSAMQMFADLGHPYSRGEPIYDVTFENVQAGERTSHLFRLANFYGGLVVGTSDLSELALGYTTYGVGDHMSHYAVNASVPKTLIRHLIHWIARKGEFGPAVAEALQRVLKTRSTPELIPASKSAESRRGSAGDDEDTSVAAESVVGPYELQDFNLYYLSRFGYRPSKVAFLAHQAWSNIEGGEWPQSTAPGDRHAYTLAEIKQWLEVFIVRFFALSQFKRSALPNGPKVGSGGSLSPRSDWRAPSDVSAKVWLEELRRNVP